MILSLSAVAMALRLYEHLRIREKSLGMLVSVGVGTAIVYLHYCRRSWIKQLTLKRGTREDALEDEVEEGPRMVAVPTVVETGNVVVVEVAEATETGW
jgi:hypothetical protein